MPLWKVYHPVGAFTAKRYQRTRLASPPLDQVRLEDRRRQMFAPVPFFSPCPRL